MQLACTREGRRTSGRPVCSGAAHPTRQKPGQRSRAGLPPREDPRGGLIGGAWFHICARKGSARLGRWGIFRRFSIPPGRGALPDSTAGMVTPLRAQTRSRRVSTEGARYARRRLFDIRRAEPGQGFPISEFRFPIAGKHRNPQPGTWNRQRGTRNSRSSFNAEHAEPAEKTGAYSCRVRQPKADHHRRGGGRCLSKHLQSC